MPWGPASFMQDWKVSPGTRGYILLPVDTKAVWKASQERTGLECSSWCCSGLLIHVWSLLGLAQLYLLPLLVLAFKRILQMKKVACAVFWSKWKRKVPSSQACFQLLLCLRKAGRLRYFGGCSSSVCVPRLLLHSECMASLFYSHKGSCFAFDLGMDLIRAMTWIPCKAIKFQVV